MNIHPILRATAFAAVVLSIVPSARADGPAVVVAIEASGTRADAVRIRAGIAEALGISAVSTLDARRQPTLGVLSIAITERGRRAAIHFLPTDGLTYAAMVDVRAEGRADPIGLWLVEPCASVVRTRRRSAWPAWTRRTWWIRGSRVTRSLRARVASRARVSIRGPARRARRHASGSPNITWPTRSKTPGRRRPTAIVRSKPSVSARRGTGPLVAEG